MSNWVLDSPGMVRPVCGVVHDLPGPLRAIAILINILEPPLDWLLYIAKGRFGTTSNLGVRNL